MRQIISWFSEVKKRISPGAHPAPQVLTDIVDGELHPARTSFSEKFPNTIFDKVGKNTGNDEHTFLRLQSEPCCKFSNLKRREERL